MTGWMYVMLLVTIYLMWIEAGAVARYWIDGKYGTYEEQE
jgi:hypothetical protein